MVKEWFKLACKSSNLQLTGTLNGGQSFRWKKLVQDSKDHWIGVFSNKVWILQQDCDRILYQVYGADHDSDLNEQYCNELLSNYLHLDVDLSEHYPKWSDRDPHFKEAAKQFYGIRILRQDPTENIFSFICSQNNHISRISSMVEKLAQYYGKKICDIDGTSYYSFPEVNALADNSVEQKLRNNGFGYRAKYISNSAKTIVENGGKKWLDELSEMSYVDSKRNLMSLMGIGAKVADCICLMSLGHLEAIPVDTHIYQIAARLYMPKLAKQKTVTEKIYNEIGDHFRGLYGHLAGWAHTVLFCADLKKFQDTGSKKETVKTKSKKQRVS
ncbi:N-glycosylase/DNA lyase [Sitophilus oryzae]|uniref:N-glycosylase/DNA lyase n=1 Tax=Sitophilus oryzae TaxID=7048 RepID=A0A6J2YJE2_SITOR|nr:N-glycosylase/DNA lyase [Sitophilus oryzae]